MKRLLLSLSILSLLLSTSVNAGTTPMQEMEEELGGCQVATPIAKKAIENDFEVNWKSIEDQEARRKVAHALDRYLGWLEDVSSHSHTALKRAMKKGPQVDKALSVYEYYKNKRAQTMKGWTDSWMNGETSTFPSN